MMMMMMMMIRCSADLDRLDHLDELVLVRANNLSLLRALHEDHEGGHRTDATRTSDLLAIIDVHFDKDHLPFILLSLRLENRRDHLTRAAPCRCTSIQHIQNTCIHHHQNYPFYVFFTSKHL